MSGTVGDEFEHILPTAPAQPAHAQQPAMDEFEHLLPTREDEDAAVAADTLGVLASEDARIADQLRVAHASSDTRYSAKVRCSRARIPACPPCRAPRGTLCLNILQLWKSRHCARV